MLSIFLESLGAVTSIAVIFIVVGFTVTKILSKWEDFCKFMRDEQEEANLRKALKQDLDRLALQLTQLEADYDKLREENARLRKFSPFHGPYRSN